MGFGPGTDGTDQPVGGLGKLGVDVVPFDAGGGVKVDLPDVSGRCEMSAETFLHSGAGEGIGVPAVGQEPVAAAGDEAEAVQKAVGGLDVVGVGGELGGGDVADYGDVGG